MPSHYSEKCLFGTELAVFRNNVLIKCNWYLPTETFRLHASTKNSEQHGRSSLEAGDISYKNTKHFNQTNSPSLPSLANPIYFWKSTTVCKYWEINLAGFPGNAAIDKHKWVHSAPNTYLGGFSISVSLCLFLVFFNCIVVEETQSIPFLPMQRPQAKEKQQFTAFTLYSNSFIILLESESLYL